MNNRDYIVFLFVVGALIAWDFVFQYAFRARWYTHKYGRINLAFMAIIALIMTTVVANIYFRHYPGRDFFRELQYTLFVVGLVTLDIFLHAQLRKSDGTNGTDETNTNTSDAAEVKCVECGAPISQSDS